MSTAVNQNYFFHTTYTNKLSQFNKIRDCVSGDEKIKEEGTVYLPKPSGMNADAYANYKTRAFFYPVTERTVRGLVGTIFQVPPTFKLPKKLEYLIEDATPEGDSLQHSAREAAEEVVTMGRFGMMVDLPTNGGGVPYIAHFRAEDITNWERQFINGKRMLTRVVVRESGSFDYGANDEHRFLELYLEFNRDDEGNVAVDPVYKAKRWTLKFGKDESGGNMTPRKTPSGLPNYNYDSVPDPVELSPTIQGKPLNYIPFFFINTMSVKPTLEKSPLLDLCDANLSHYTIHADYRHCLFMLSQPTPYIIGDLEDDEVPTKIGASVFWHLPSSVTDVGMLEFTGAGIGALEAALDKHEGYMAALGAKLIHRQDVEETAEATKVKTREALSVIENVVLSLGEAYGQALRACAEWMGINPDQVEAIFNTEFVQVMLDSGMLAALVKTWQEGGISRSVYHRNLQRGQIIPHDRTIEEEEEEIAEEQAKRMEDAKKKRDAFGVPDPNADPNGDQEDDQGDGKDGGKKKPPTGEDDSEEEDPNE